MNLRRVLILIGLAAILAGCLAPVYKQGGTQYFFLSGQYWGSSTFVLFTLIAAFAVLAMKKEQMLWVFGLIFLGWFINDLRLAWERIPDLENSHLGWGWLLLINGALLIALTLFLGEDREIIGGFFASLEPEAPFEGDDEGDTVEDDESDEEQAPDAAE
jgi:hypothetical protein